MSPDLPRLLPSQATVITLIKFAFNIGIVFERNWTSPFSPPAQLRSHLSTPSGSLSPLSAHLQPILHRLLLLCSINWTLYCCCCCCLFECSRKIAAVLCAAVLRLWESVSPLLGHHSAHSSIHQKLTTEVSAYCLANDICTEITNNTDKWKWQSDTHTCVRVLKYVCLFTGRPLVCCRWATQSAGRADRSDRSNWRVNLSRQAKRQPFIARCPVSVAGFFSFVSAH